MKKYFLSIVALAGMLFATSCQESLVEPQVDGTTTFTIEIPGQMGTKAVGDSYELFVEVYSADGNTKIHRLEDAITVGTPKNVSLNLVATQVYDIIFWAQKDGATYNVENLNKVEITNRHHNSEDGAAFYAIKNDYKPVEVNNPSVTLKRPFAQLNIGTIDEVSYGDNNGNKKLKILSTNIKVESAANYFERINTQEFPELGEGRTDVVFEYTGGEVLTSTMTIGEGANAKTYKQVSMDYISVLGNKGVVTVTATIEVRDPNGVESTIERVITNVPLQMNYRTNIVGNLITSASDFTIEISEDWDGTDIDKEVVFREVATAAELQEAINDGVDNITLSEDITVNSTLVFKAVPSQSNISRASADVAEFVLDLNGKNLSYAVQDNVGASAIINIHPNAKLSIVGNGTISFVSANPDTQAIPSYATNTITNEGYLVIGEGVVVINESEGGASYAVDDKGKFVLNGGTLIGKRCALRIAKYNQDNVYFEMNGGMVTAQTPAWIQLPGSDANSAPKIDVVINNGTFQSTNSTSAENDLLYTYYFGNSHANTTLTINGGNFIGGTVSIGAGYKGDSPAININGGAFDYDVVRWLEDDASEVIYSANPTAVYIPDPAQLTNDVIENNETIYLAEGEYTIELYTNISPKESLTIIGTEGTKVKFANKQVRMQLFKNFTIKNCEILPMATKGWGMLVFGGGDKADGVYTIENCTFNGVGTQGIYINEDIDGAIYNITNCTFNNNFGSEGAITIQTNQGVNHIVNVTGCKFNNVPANNRIFLAPNKVLFYDFTLNTDLEATTADEFNMFVKLGLQNIRLADGVYNAEYFYLKGKNINISAVNPGNVTINSFVHLNGGKYNFNGITFMNPNQNTNPEAIGEEQKAFQYKSCVGVANMPTEVLFEDCKFVIENVDYAMWAHCYTTSIFENCYFECNHLRPIATNGPRTIVNNCVFNNQHHYALRLFENNHNSQYVEFTNNTITGTRSPGKVDSEGINISKKDGSANITGTFVIKGNTDGLKYRHHEKVTMDASCVYDTDIENFAFEREQ